MSAKSSAEPQNRGDHAWIIMNFYDLLLFSPSLRSVSWSQMQSSRRIDRHVQRPVYCLRYLDFPVEGEVVDMRSAVEYTYIMYS